METPDAQASKRFRNGVNDTSSGDFGLRPWYQYPSAASRICRVSRASGGKDRHSKVLTAKGLRDRRVRLSVSTAIQFYDLQDRLGYDQPSKAVEWLIKAAAVAIADLPSLDGAFPDLPLLEDCREHDINSTQIVDEDDGDDLGYAANRHNDDNQMQQQDYLAKSACSSTSETSRGSVLSLSRSEIRIKARERARERTATAKREKDKEGDDTNAQIASDMNPSSHGSFIELLTGNQNQSQRQNHGTRQLPATADYLGQNHVFSNQATFNMASGDHHEMMHHHHNHHHQQQQQLSFLPDHLIPFARGTLQSNFTSPTGTSNLPFFLNATWDSHLQLCYDGCPHLDLKGKDKS